MLANLRIHWKLLLLSTAFLVPIIALAWLFIDQSYKDIRFAAKELDGSRYLATLREVAVPLALDDGATAAGKLTAVEAVNEAIGATLNLGDTFAKLVAAVHRAAAAKGDDAADANLDALAAVREVVDRVGDGSNLILDPDLDSFYSMDLVVVKLPQATAQASIVEAAVRQAQSGKPTVSSVANLQMRLGEFTAVVAGVDASLQSALRGNPDGSLKIALDQPFLHYRDATRAYSEAVEALGKAAAAGQVPRPSGSDFPKLKAAVAEQGAAAWRVAESEMDRLLAARIAGFEHRLYWSLGAVGLVLLGAALLAMRIALSISRPVADLVLAMKGMADGDMTVEVPWRHRRDEAGMLADGAAEMESQLHGLATQVRSHAGLVHGSARKIAESVEGQAVGSSQMTASVTEITATMEEFSASTVQISEYSNSVVEVANATYDNSRQGRDALELLTDKMGNIQEENQSSLAEIIRLGEASKEISKVMKIITAIADQTKLIAFNAALEAASAGEAGRRFGVVAAEIRRLADNVTESTGEIESKVTLIQDAINRLVVTSEKGTASIVDAKAAATDTASMLDEMVEAAKRTTTAAQQISLSTSQQKTAAGQVLVALREIVDASSHNAKSMGQLSDVSRNMASLSSDLDTLVDRFRLTPQPVAAD